MDRKYKRILCMIAAVLLLTGCKSGKGKNTDPTVSPQTTAPVVSSPTGGGVEDWDEPAQTNPVQSTEPAETTRPTEDPEVDPPVETAGGSTEPSTDASAPTEPMATNPQAQPTEPSEPQQTNPPQAGGSDPAALTYEEYLAMSPAQQQAHYELFPSFEAYVAWHNAALAEYEEHQSSIEVTGPIDIGDFMNP